MEKTSLGQTEKADLTMETEELKSCASAKPIKNTPFELFFYLTDLLSYCKAYKEVLDEKIFPKIMQEIKMYYPYT